MRERKIKLLAAVLLLAIALQTTAAGNTQSKKEDCEKVKQQIRAIEAKMRNGYSAAQGIRLDERLRLLKDKRYKLCR